MNYFNFIYRFNKIKLNGNIHINDLVLITSSLKMDKLQTKQEQEQLPQEQLITQYLQEMGTLERQAYEIARSHLGTSFNIAKSNGFIQWVKGK